MNINFIMQSMFITPKQAVELFNLNIDQNVSMFFWGEILHEGQQCWGLFLIADEDTDPQYLTGDERAEALHNSGVDVEQLVENMRHSNCHSLCRYSKTKS